MTSITKDLVEDEKQEEVKNDLFLKKEETKAFLWDFSIINKIVFFITTLLFLFFYKKITTPPPEKILLTIK